MASSKIYILSTFFGLKSHFAYLKFFDKIYLNFALLLCVLRFALCTSKWQSIFLLPAGFVPGSEKALQRLLLACF